MHLPDLRGDGAEVVLEYGVKRFTGDGVINRTRNALDWGMPGGVGKNKSAANVENSIGAGGDMWGKAMVAIGRPEVGMGLSY